MQTTPRRSRRAWLVAMGAGCIVLATASPSRAQAPAAVAGSCAQSLPSDDHFDLAMETGGPRLRLEFPGASSFRRKPEAIAHVRAPSRAYWLLGRRADSVGFTVGDVDGDGLADTGVIRDASGMFVVEVLSSADLLRRHVNVQLTRVHRLTIVSGKFSDPQPVLVTTIPDCTGDGRPDLAVETSDNNASCEPVVPTCDPYEEVDLVRRYVIDGRRAAALGTLRLGSADAPVVSSIRVARGALNS
jgi:hypothetical protein